MSDCCETFEMRGLKGKELQRYVYENHKKWFCEQCICGSNSPGPVSDDEILIFLLINPTHFDSVTGQLSPEAFQEVHNRDLSVIRTRHASREEIDKTKLAVIESAMKRVPPKLRRIDHFATARAESIRKERDEVERLFAVYDTPLPERHSHASVFTRPDVIDSRRLKMVARQRLHSVFSKNVRSLSALDEAIEG